MSPGQIFITTLITVLAGAIVALAKVVPEIRHLRATTRQALVDAETSEGAQDDAHWEAIIRAQTEALLTPLTKEVERQGEKIVRQDKKISDQDQKITDLERQMRSIQYRYRLALDHLRDYVRYSLLLVGLLHPDVTPPPPPSIANEIAEDI